MALRKQKKYNWKETNLAYFGSDLEKQVLNTLKGCASTIFVAFGEKPLVWRANPFTSSLLL